MVRPAARRTARAPHRDRGAARPQPVVGTTAIRSSRGSPATIGDEVRARRLGGLALAAAALLGEAVAVCHADVPFLCDIQRAVTITGEMPYAEVAEFARRVTAECLLSTGLMDDVCPPSTVFGAYNEITAVKDIAVHPFSGHAVPAAHVERQLRHLRRVFGLSAPERALRAVVRAYGDVGVPGCRRYPAAARPGSLSHCSRPGPSSHRGQPATYTGFGNHISGRTNRDHVQNPV